MKVKWSLPSRERGLKCCAICIKKNRRLSLPSRERGLKFSAFINNRDTVAVAPLAGAWIEMIQKGDVGE